MTKEELEKENEVLKKENRHLKKENRHLEKENRYLEHRNDLLRIELELRYRDLSQITQQELKTIRGGKMTEKLLENQKIIADEISVPLSKKELELLIYKLSDMPITNKQALDIYQKLTNKLETLEQNND